LTVVILLQLNTIENADALVDFSNTTITSSEPPIIRVQPPFYEKTGQTILSPHITLIERDLLTGQVQVIEDNITGNSLIEDQKVQKPILKEDQNLGLNLVDFKEE